MKSKRKATLPSLVLWLFVAGLNYLVHPHMTIPEWVVFYTLTGLLILVERFRVLVDEDEQFSLETVYLVAFSLTYPIHTVVWAGLVYAVVSAFRYKKWAVQLLNGTALVIFTVVATVVFKHATHGQLLSEVTEYVPLSLYIGTYFTANIFFVFLYMCFTSGFESAFTALKSSITKRFIIVYGVTFLLGILLSIVTKYSGLSGVLLFTGLVLLVAHSYRDYFQMANHFKELAIRDELTGLHNHRYIQSCMDNLISQKKPFSLIMLDIDNFKRYNERFGHVTGDEALRMLANTLASKRLKDEEIARYSGEEFLILLPEYDLAQAKLKAELVRKAVEDTKFPGEDTKTWITVSVGVAIYPDMADNKRDLLMAVDDALYKGKLTGRNRVNIYTSVLDDLKQDLQIGHEDQELIKTIKVFLAILNSKDRYTLAHTERDVLYADALAQRIGLSEERRRYLRLGAFLHDIGKVEIPIEILTKRGHLTRDEWLIMKSHVEIGENIARPIPGLGPCLPIIRHHHERFDGKGYPDGLAGEEIPLEARILTIADSFDAMTTSRPYQKKRSMESAFNELRACAGTQFDPDLVEPFIEVVREIGLLTDEEEEELA